MQKVDKEKIAKGIWFECTAYPNSDGTVPRVLMGYMGDTNRRYQLRLEALTRPHRRQLQLGTYGDANAERLQMKAFIETALFGWENVQPDDDGNAIPFSPENAEQFLNEDENALFTNWLKWEAQQLENFAAERKKIEAKN